MVPSRKLVEFVILSGIILIMGRTTPANAKEVKDCEELKLPQNVQMHCRDEKSRHGQIEYTCTYKCKQHYTPHESTSGTTKEHKIHCHSNGKWTDIQKFQTFTCREDCGRRPLKGSVPFVVHGTATNTTSWPWHVAIFRNTNLNSSKNANATWSYLCGGSLIRDSVVLTAAHCITEQNGKLLDPDLFKVVLGAQSSNYLTTLSHRSSQEFGVKRMFASPNYDTKDHEGDIALLHLNGNGVRFNDHVIPVCLPNDGALDLNAIAAGRSGDVVGFGIDETRNISLILKHAALTIASPAECFNTLNRIISVSQFCAGNRRDDDQWVTVCNGDSGGGFVVPSAIHQRYYIHGIVSTGDLNSRRYGGVCRNHVVFTRIFQFIFWIRDVLERIHGEIIRELTASTKYPYSLTGTETAYVQFSPIPRQWDNLVTSIKLTYATVEPEILFQSLQQNVGMEHLNLTQVRFTGKIRSGKAVLLPHLKSYVLDVPVLDCWKHSGGASTSGWIGLKSSSNLNQNCIQKDPAKMTRLQLKSLLFFDKYETDWPVENIYELNTNIDVILHTSRLLQVDHDTGKFTCQIPFCSKILGNKAYEQILRYLALSKSELDVGSLLQRNSELFTHLQVLVLDKVQLYGGRLSDILQRSPELDTLAVSVDVENDITKDESFRRLYNFDEIPKPRDDQYSISISTLPKTLKHLICGGISLKLNTYEAMTINIKEQTNQRRPNPSVSSLFSPISFPGKYESVRAPAVDRIVVRAKGPRTFSKLETFVCNLCTMDDSLVKNFVSIFPNLKRILFVGQQGINVTQILLKLNTLQTVVFINIEEAVGEKSDSFSGLEPYNIQEESEFLLSRTSTGWKRFKLKNRPEFILHRFFNLGNFWTSFDEFEADARLTSFEKLAYNTGKYTFRPPCGSSTNDKCDKFQRMPKIPPAIQNALKSVEVENVEVIPGELLDSLHSAYELETLILNNVRLLGYFVNFIELPNLRQYRLHALSSFENFVDQTSAVYGAKLYIPFGKSPEGTQGGSTRRYDAIPNSANKIETFEIVFDNCKVLVVDYKKGEIISTPKVAREILPHLRSTNLTTVALRLSESELSGLTVPLKVEYLDLRCKTEYEWNCSRVLTNLITPLKALKELRLAQHHVYDEHELLGRTKFKLEDIGISAPTLEFLGSDEAHFEFTHSIPNFPNLKTIFLETCTFDPQIVQRFFQIFSQVKIVALLSYGYDKYGPVSKSSYLAVNEKILLAALQNRNVHKVVGNLGSIEDVNEKTGPLWKILMAAGVSRNQFHEFILNRNDISGKWVSDSIGIHESQSRRHLFQSELRRLRGDSVFGANSCINRLFDY